MSSCALGQVTTSRLISDVPPVKTEVNAPTSTDALPAWTPGDAERRTRTCEPTTTDVRPLAASVDATTEARTPGPPTREHYTTRPGVRINANTPQCATLPLLPTATDPDHPHVVHMPQLRREVNRPVETTPTAPTEDSRRHPSGTTSGTSRREPRRLVDAELTTPEVADGDEQ